MQVTMRRHMPLISLGAVTVVLAVLPMTGALRSWRFAGPFGRFADLAFFTEFEPEGDSSLADHYVINGRERPTRRHDSRITDIEPSWIDYGVTYAETFVRTAAPVIRRYVSFESSSVAGRRATQGRSLELIAWTRSASRPSRSRVS